MSEVKDHVIRLIRDLPEDCSLKDILQEVATVALVERGLADSEAGRFISHEAMGREIESWRKQSGSR
ncbi:MAG: hypothetical protein KJ067_24685 [Vicinamibacteria bacterium]|nr:hypothetical protein [Vicinamibacteria bacterium]